MSYSTQYIIVRAALLFGRQVVFSPLIFVLRAYLKYNLQNLWSQGCHMRTWSSVCNYKITQI